MIIEHVWSLSFDTGTNGIEVYVNYLASCTLAPFSARGLIQLDLAIAFPLIDVLLGGEGTGQPPTREITEIEEQIFETVMCIICRELQTAWQALAQEFQFEQRQHVTVDREGLASGSGNLAMRVNTRSPQPWPCHGHAQR